MLLLVLADIGCSSSFWKKLEPIFSPVSLKDMSYLKQLVGAFTIFAFMKFMWPLLEALLSPPFMLTILCYSWHQLKTTEADLRCLSQMLGIGSDALVMHKKLIFHISSILSLCQLITNNWHGKLGIIFNYYFIEHVSSQLQLAIWI